MRRWEEEEEEEELEGEGRDYGDDYDDGDFLNSECPWPCT